MLRHSPISDSDAGSVPPSRHSYPTSLQLRENRPKAVYGLAALHRISDGGIYQRKSNTSNTDLASDDEKSMSTSVMIAPSAATSATNAKIEKRPKDPADELQQPKKKKKKKKSKKENEATETTPTDQLELAQDEPVNSVPFPSFKPYQLAHLLDPKDLGTLTALDGTYDIIRDLSTHGLDTDDMDGSLEDVGDNYLQTLHSRNLTTLNGLTTTSLHTSEKPPQGAGQDPSHSHDPEKQSLEVDDGLPNIMLTETSGKEGVPSEGDDNAPYSGTIDDRKHVYGENVLPARISKTLLQLMSASLQDDTLLMPSIAAVISLAFCLFQNFGSPSGSENSPADWVEGVAIVVAILIVVTIFLFSIEYEACVTFLSVFVSSLNDWKNERQVLDERKGERGVKVIRDGIEKVIDIKELVVGDIALVEPGEIIPCDGIFISGHKVKCDESGVTGESDAIKKFSYNDVVELTRSRDAGSLHTDCFIISGSKITEGIGKYVVIAVGTKSFNGRIMMALRTDIENKLVQIREGLITRVASISRLAMVIALVIKPSVPGADISSHKWDTFIFVTLIVESLSLIVLASAKHQSKLAQEESVNCAPFRFKQSQLAHMLDPKDIGTLTALGGTDGILRGLGTHSEHGLTTTLLHTGGKLPQSAGQDASVSHDSERQSWEVDDELPDITLTETSGQEGVPSEGDDNAPDTETIDDRVENALPTRINKMVLQLLAALGVLNPLSIPVVTALALGQSRRFGTSRDSGDPHVDWVRVITVAAISVAVAGAVNGWWKRQPKRLGEYRKERGVEVTRDGVEKVKESTMEDVAPLEPCGGGEVVSQASAAVGKRKRRRKTKKSNGVIDSLLDRDDAPGKILTSLLRTFSAEEASNAASKRRAEASDTSTQVPGVPFSGMLLNPVLDVGVDMSIAQFCENYGLQPAIHKKLDDNGFDQARNLRFITLDNLTEMGFKLGEKAVLQDAVERWAIHRA